MDLPFDDIQKVLYFLNWQMLAAVGLITMAWIQLAKKYIPDVCCVGKFTIPVTVLFTLVSGMILAHFIFDIAGVKHNETIALFHGFVGALFSTLGYELLKGTKFGLRSSTDMKDAPPTKTEEKKEEVK